MAIGIGGDHPQLLRRLERHPSFAGRYFDADDMRIAGVTEGDPGRNPLLQRLIFVRCANEANTAPAWEAATRLGQQQAALRMRRKTTPAPDCLRERHVIGLRIEPEDRQLETILCSRFPVAARHIAAELA